MQQTNIEAQNSIPNSALTPSRHLFCQILVVNRHSFCQLFNFHELPSNPQKIFEKYFKKCRRPLIYKEFRHFQGGIFFVNSPQNKKHFARSAFCFGGATPSSSRAPHAAGARNPVRIRRPKIGELAHQAQGVRIFAEGEIPGAREEQAPPLPLTSRPFYAIIDSERRWRYEKIIFCLVMFDFNY